MATGTSQQGRVGSKLEPVTRSSMYAGPQRENFPGGTKVDTGPPNLIGPPSLIGGLMPLNHFLPDGC